LLVRVRGGGLNAAVAPRLRCRTCSLFWTEKPSDVGYIGGCVVVVSTSKKLFSAEVVDHCGSTVVLRIGGGNATFVFGGDMS
tara:strand:- start:6046 stop:6291 length:246 start_codon:yes stop_codon:yes gene_type:complete